MCWFLKVALAQMRLLSTIRFFVASILISQHGFFYTLQEEHFMKSTTKVLILALCVGAMSEVASGQTPCSVRPVTDPEQLPYHEFRSVQNGDWTDHKVWDEYYPETTQWCWPAEHVPDFEKGYIIVQHYTNGTEDTVRITSPVFADQLTVDGRLEIRGPNGHLTVSKGDNNDPYDLVGGGDLVIDGGLSSKRLSILSEAKVHIKVGGDLKILEGPLVSIAKRVASASIENLGDVFIDGTFTSEGGSVTGNPFRYGSNATLVLNNAAGSVIDSSSTLWPSTNGPPIVNARGPVTMNVPRTVSYFTTAARVTNAYNLSFSHLSFADSRVTVDSGGFFDSSPLYSDNVNLIYHGGINYNVGNEWASGTSVGRGVPNRVIINDANVNMPSGPRRCPGDLVISGGALILSTSAGANLSVGGNFSLYGTLIQNSKELTLDGSTEQYVYGGPITFDDLTINNPAGIYLRGGRTEVKQTLTFLAGTVITDGAYGPPLILSGDVVGASPTSHILTTGTGYGGKVIRSIAGGDSFQFPIGPTAASYNPLTIALDPADPTETFSVSVASAATPPYLFVQPIWTIRETTEGGNHAALTFQWAGADEGANFNRNASSTFYSAGGPYVEVARNGLAIGSNPYVVSTTGGFPCTEFHPNSVLSSYVVGNAPVTNIEGSKNGIPTSFALSENYPNPFNPSTTIRYAIPKAVFVALGIYNILGKEIATLVSEKQPAGEYTVRWNPVGVPSGVYFYRLKAEEFTATRKLILLQ
jgi:Secretion system C-terminal sorting domain